ncbi:streptosactin export ABC transporter GggC [Streptococcus zalophi]|uniref:ABC transporter ATP-binding protein n=1 Tax=Streptococcus zalophi TaxID=640031 RepID=A0A934P8E2_9STRE|nr:ABC transporter ATP-binding protein [Streptococcus zalophi]MBJ8349119.1 ABC transporter ATP-binding protein [Streptococcus zalophi]
MLKQFILKRHLFLYSLFIAVTWLEAVITPGLISMIVSSFEEKNLDVLWQALFLGVIGNLIILVGLAGKRYYYARLVADFTLAMKRRLFKHFLYDKSIGQSDILSSLENDVKQLEVSYLEPAVIIMSSLGFTSVSIIYALVTNFWLGLIFVFFYSIPTLCSGIGSKKLDQISKEKSTVNQNYLSQVTNIIDGERVIKNYDVRDFFFKRFLKYLTVRINQDIHYEQQRTVNNVIINSIDAFCSVVPIIIGGVMTYYDYLSGASFVGIYLVSYNISYQFNELSYFINTYKSSKKLRDQYAFLLQDNNSENIGLITKSLFPIVFDQVSLKFGDKNIFQNLSFTIQQGEKIAIIGPSGSGKTTLLNMIYGAIVPDSGEISFSGQVLEKRQHSMLISYVLQDSYIFDGLSLEENIALGKSINSHKTHQILTSVNLLSLKNHQLIYANELSGGEKQRLEIARSLYHDSQLILADEIKSNLDKTNASRISEILMTSPQTLVEVIHHYDDETLARYDKIIDLSEQRQMNL